MSINLFEAKRQRLQQMVIDSILNLFEHMGGISCCPAGMQGPLIEGKKDIWWYAGDENVLNLVSKLSEVKTELAECKVENEALDRYKENLARVLQEERLENARLKKQVEELEEEIEKWIHRHGLAIRKFEDIERLKKRLLEFFDRLCVSTGMTNQSPADMKWKRQIGDRVQSIIKECTEDKE